MASIPAGATPLGSKMYLFKSKSNSSDCIISAHGGYMAANRSFTVPQGVQVVFYGPHGASLFDPNISTFMNFQGKAISVEVFEGGSECRNYLLQKYQGAHAGSDGKTVLETYDQIRSSIQSNDNYRQTAFNAAVKARSLAQPNAGIVQMQMDKIKTAQGGSVLTIRNRWNVIAGMPLSEAVAQARAEMPTLRVFHALFCRSYMLGEDLLPGASMQYR